MTLPGVTISKRDGGLGVTSPATSVPLLIGTCTLGASGDTGTLTNSDQAQDALGQGPLAEAACVILDRAGGPVHYMVVARSGGGVGATTTTKADLGSPSTGTGSIGLSPGPMPADAYTITVEVLNGGSVAGQDLRARFSLDGGVTYSESKTVPATGILQLGESGMAITFVDLAGPKFFEAGDLHTSFTTAPVHTSAAVDAAYTIASTALLGKSWDFIVATDAATTAADGVALAASIGLINANLVATKRYSAALGMCDNGSLDTVAASELAAETWVDDAILPVYSIATVTSSKPFEGFGRATCSIAVAVATRAAKVGLSEHLFRTLRGPLSGVMSIAYDEALTEDLHDNRVCAPRTYHGFPGFYLATDPMHATPGSDFESWPRKRIMNAACQAAYDRLVLLLGSTVRTNVDGTIDERDAKRVETRLNQTLRALLLTPKDAEGQDGHVSAVYTEVDRATNILVTQTLNVRVRIRPKGTIKYATGDVGYALNLDA